MFTLLRNLIAISLISWGIYVFNSCLSIYDRLEELNIIPSSPPRHHFYDYIIVGVGTGGATILSELNCGTTTLVIEAGTYPIPVVMDIPILTPLFHQTMYDWQYKTVPQKHACQAMKNNECSFTAGKGFGGSNIINNLIYHRGVPEDYRGWFDGTCSYNYSRDIEPYFIINENNYKPTPLEYVSTFGQEFSAININHLKFEVPKVLQRNGRRLSPLKFVKKLNCRMKNIERLHNAMVTKVLFGTGRNPLRAVGVQYIKYDEVYAVYARRAVILSAGTVGTPKILLQSGVGPCNELRRLGIECVLNLPPVGRNLQDHLATGMDLIRINENLNLSPISLLGISNILQYFNPFDQPHGPLTTVGCDLIGTLDNGEKIGYMVLPMGITADYGVKLRNIMNLNDTYWENYYEELINTQTVSILPILLHPRSRGVVKLTNANPTSPPYIDPQYLSHPDDLEELLQGFEWIKRMLHTRQMKALQAEIDDRHFPGCKKFSWNTKDYWRCYIKHMSFSVYHPVGTCKMGDEHDPDTVVLRNFQVKDIEGLYVVDASLMPNLPSGNINAAVAMLARKFLDTFGQL